LPQFFSKSKSGKRVLQCFVQNSKKKTIGGSLRYKWIVECNRIHVCCNPAFFWRPTNRFWT
jgi:hypothetical protein